MLLDSIHGQDQALATLRNALTSSRLAHAYLFIGPTGVGKKTTALALARAILCQEQPQEGCGTCSACVSVAAGTHPDLTQVAPEAGKRSIVIDQVRDLQRLLSLRPVLGGKKVAILDEAHLLTGQAQSALLKLVEEPAGDALLLLLTVNAATLSRPLLSRCQQVRFSLLSPEVVEAQLLRDYGKDAATAHALALHSRGSLGRAVTLDPELFTEERKYVEEELQKLPGAAFSELSRFAEWLTADRVKKSKTQTDASEERPTGNRLELVLSWCEETLRCTVLGREGIVRHQENAALLLRRAAALGVEGALRQLTLVYDTIQALDRNANRQLAVEDLLIQLSRE